MTYNIDGQRVSKPWHNVLLHYRRMGVDFHINSGRRTMHEQALLVAQKGLFSASNPTGAARPSLAAPHINYGRANHAIDADGAAGLVTHLRRDGARSASRPISTEPWHIQISRSDLLALDRRIRANR